MMQSNDDYSSSINEPLNQQLSVDSMSQSNGGPTRVGISNNRSLLERIRVAQQQKQQPQQQPSQIFDHNNSIAHNSNNAGTPASQPPIQVPQYNPVSQIADDGGIAGSRNAVTDPTSSTNLFTDAFSSLNISGNFLDFGSGGVGDVDANSNMNDSLLPPSIDRAYYYDGSGEYSITKYFMTFIMDIYSVFLRLPVPVRCIVVIVLMYVALKLI